MKTGNTAVAIDRLVADQEASMEPGHEDREYVEWETHQGKGSQPQWSPVMKTGNTGHHASTRIARYKPQWSPVMKTGNTHLGDDPPPHPAGPQWSPVMKTGNTHHPGTGCRRQTRPQWSPVMKTGNTGDATRRPPQPPTASMEPGHEDREYTRCTIIMPL